jgi:hypothetical protein
MPFQSHLMTILTRIIFLQASTDQNSVDLNIPNRVAGVAFSMIRLLGIIAVMSQVAWQVFIIFIPVVTACVWYQVIALTLSQFCYLMCFDDTFIFRMTVNMQLIISC